MAATDHGDAYRENAEVEHPLWELDAIRAELQCSVADSQALVDAVHDNIRATARNLLQNQELRYRDLRLHQ